MKFKKTAVLAMATSAMLAFSACSSKTSNESADKKTDAKATLNVFQFKVEIADELEKMAKEYEKETGVKVNIKTVGGGADYGAALKSQFASGNEPDIFNNGGFNEAITWKDKLEDLSDQPWAKEVYDEAKVPMTVDGKLYGMPMNLEGYGLIYNKELFEKAGITEAPKTLDELKAAAEKLEKSGTTPFSVGYGEWWILGIHALNVPFAQQDNPDQFIQDLSAGKAKFAGNEKFNQFFDLFDLTIKYGNKNPLTTDYNTQVTQFASGKAAMMQQGNWAQPMIDKITPNMKLGFLPMPISNDKDKMDKLFVGVPNNWVVNKNSKNKEEAKKFLNWMATSKTGQTYMVEKFKFIPAFKNIEGKNLGPLADDITKYMKENKTLSWNWFKYPDGATNEFGATMQAYVGKQKDKNQMLEDLQKTWDKLKK
ncbi:ABC transporter substrate-binding protein [Ectobacillus sp. JY-23]|uniref:ABC transporter substrate-binding protein n=1 Tax=Ectobacillus sp. JY-23 TaxID=2933872 RepID=UPI001FF0F181|nr:ABC transporter substrate-binding protein [Ectobacillus sp. JY-23]UOY91694.1 ABC transporter substrate-binding protein [Ectobacillus sp. JY-23]